VKREDETERERRKKISPPRNKATPPSPPGVKAQIAAEQGPFGKSGGLKKKATTKKKRPVRTRSTAEGKERVCRGGRDKEKYKKDSEDLTQFERDAREGKVKAKKKDLATKTTQSGA